MRQWKKVKGIKRQVKRLYHHSFPAAVGQHVTLSLWLFDASSRWFGLNYCLHLAVLLPLPTQITFLSVNLFVNSVTQKLVRALGWNSACVLDVTQEWLGFFFLFIWLLSGSGLHFQSHHYSSNLPQGTNLSFCLHDTLSAHPHPSFLISLPQVFLPLLPHFIHRLSPPVVFLYRMLSASCLSALRFMGHFPILKAAAVSGCLQRLWENSPASHLFVVR